MTRRPSNRPPRTIRVLRIVLKLDAAGSAAMPALLFAAVPVVAVLDPPAAVLVWVLLGYAVVLGALGAVIAGVLAGELRRGEAGGHEPAWLFVLPPADR